MATYVLRVWLPDRPGALGKVASRVGAVRGDVVGIDILERGGGRAVDELVVELPDTGGDRAARELVELLVQEVSQVDGVDVEEIRPVADACHDPRLDALEAAAIIVGASRRRDVLDALSTHARRVPGADWSAVTELGGDAVLAVHGEAPTGAWLTAFVEGTRSSSLVAAGERGPDDVVWAPLPSAGLALVAGRDGVPYRSRERRQLAALARIADTRVRELERARSMGRHPSSTHHVG